MHTDFHGFLFIGDPHVSSKRIGRRIDDYLGSVLQKLRECAQLCHARNLMPVILGDLFHRNDDSDLRMLNRLVAALAEFPVPPIALDGNHDKGRTQLSDEDALTLLGQLGAVRIASEPGEVAEWQMEGRTVVLHAVPYGAAIPDAVASRPGAVQVMITHHDLAFGSAYPGALPLKAVKNLDMVVNGHMHGTQPTQRHGDTFWHNPGNIEPLSLDMVDHVPCAWEWSPDSSCEALLPHSLTHGTDLFDLTGVQVAPGDADDAVQQVIQASSFAALLQSESALEAAKTDDASILADDLDIVLEASGASDAVSALLRNLVKVPPSAVPTTSG